MAVYECYRCLKRWSKLVGDGCPACNGPCEIISNDQRAQVNITKDHSQEGIVKNSNYSTSSVLPAANGSGIEPEALNHAVLWITEPSRHDQSCTSQPFRQGDELKQDYTGEKSDAVESSASYNQSIRTISTDRLSPSHSKACLRTTDSHFCVQDSQSVKYDLTPPKCDDVITYFQEASWLKEAKKDTPNRYVPHTSADKSTASDSDGTSDHSQAGSQHAGVPSGEETFLLEPAEYDFIHRHLEQISNDPSILTRAAEAAKLLERQRLKEKKKARKARKKEERAALESNTPTQKSPAKIDRSKAAQLKAHHEQAMIAKLPKPDDTIAAVFPGLSLSTSPWSEVVSKRRAQATKIASDAGRIVNATQYTTRAEFGEDAVAYADDVLYTRFNIGGAKHDSKRIVPRHLVE